MYYKYKYTWAISNEKKINIYIKLLSTFFMQKTFHDGKCLSEQPIRNTYVTYTNVI